MRVEARAEQPGVAAAGGAGAALAAAAAGGPRAARRGHLVRGRQRGQLERHLELLVRQRRQLRAPYALCCTPFTLTAFTTRYKYSTVLCTVQT